MPPLHPNCRSTISGSLKSTGRSKGTRSGRDAEGNRITVPASMVYEDFKKIYIDKSMTLQDWENSRQKISKNDIIKEKVKLALKSLAVKFLDVNYPPKKIDTEKLSFDEEHINRERQHNVSKQQAIHFINTAIISLVRYNGHCDVYCSLDGLAYVIDDTLIRTALSKSDFDDKTQKMMEVLKQYE